MPESKTKEFKKPFILIAILFVVILAFIYNRIRTNESISDIGQVDSLSVGGTFSGQKLDQEVLADQKFRDLRAIPKFQLDDLSGEISEDELDTVQRRYSNPFKPF